MGKPSLEKRYSRFFLALSLVFVVMISVCLFAVDQVGAMTLSQFDERIAGEDQALTQAQDDLNRAQEDLSNIMRLYYKVIVNDSPLDRVLEVNGISESVVVMDGLDKICAQYERSLSRTKAAYDSVCKARESVVRLREQKAARARSLESAGDVQFPQSGEQYSSVRYWNGVIADHGCGVCAYTVIVDILTGSEYSPLDMMAIRGDWRGMDGFPDDMTGSGGVSHKEWTLRTFDIDTWNIDVSVEALKDALVANERCAMICAAGNSSFKNKSGAWRYSSGHFVAVFAYDENGFHVSDSAYSHDEGADVVYSDEEMAKMLLGGKSITVYSN